MGRANESENQAGESVKKDTLTRCTTHTPIFRNIFLPYSIIPTTQGFPNGLLTPRSMGANSTVGSCTPPEYFCSPLYNIVIRMNVLEISLPVEPKGGERRF